MFYPLTGDARADPRVSIWPPYHLIMVYTYYPVRWTKILSPTQYCEMGHTHSETVLSRRNRVFFVRFVFLYKNCEKVSVNFQKLLRRNGFQICQVIGKIMFKLLINLNHTIDFKLQVIFVKNVVLGKENTSHLVDFLKCNSTYFFLQLLRGCNI